jgi:hypothetical protein
MSHVMSIIKELLTDVAYQLSTLTFIVEDRTELSYGADSDTQRNK